MVGVSLLNSSSSRRHRPAFQISPFSLLPLLNLNRAHPAGTGTATASAPTRLLRPTGSSSYPFSLHFCSPISPLRAHLPPSPPHAFSYSSSSSSANTFVEQLPVIGYSTTPTPTPTRLDESWEQEPRGFEFNGHVDSSSAFELRELPFTSPSLHAKELEELPENWRRSKLAWMCKELPAHKRPTITRILNAHKKWMRQDDATYIAVHCIRIRENEPAFWVFKWMSQQYWFQFDFALATKLADYMGREGKFNKCREIFDHIINQGRVPCESTFHILIVGYLSATSGDCLHEACDIYHRMIELGGYRPQLSLHNALFRALLSKQGSFVKQYLKQAEFIFHNLVTTGFSIHEDIFRGLIWLHSYQDNVDKERISSLRAEMKLVGIEESKDVLLSILRACSKIGDVAEAERTWLKLLSCGGGIIPSQAFVYKMDVYARSGDPTKALDVLREMKKELGDVRVAAYHKAMEVLCEAHEREMAESLMKELAMARLKPLTPSYVSLMSMYFRLGLHDKVESAFCACLKHCHPNGVVYGIYLDSLVQSGSIEKAEEVFSHMLVNNASAVNSRSCNTILKGYLSSEDHENTLKMYDYMRQKKYEIEASLMDKLDGIVFLRRTRRMMKKATCTKLTQVQREILVGLLLGGLRIEPDEQDRKRHFLYFEFDDNSATHLVLKRHIYDLYHEWVHPSSKPIDDRGNNIIPCRFSTLSHASFSFYAEQFWRLIHRWLTPCALAYWYMYGGHRTSSGDILLKLKGEREGVERILEALKARSLTFRVKQKSKVFWLGVLGSNSTCIWNLMQRYILDDLKADGSQPAAGRTFT
ncbi:Pentatricopeptide repeat-containing protein [Dionaea muscipula]